MPIKNFIIYSSIWCRPWDMILKNR